MSRDEARDGLRASLRGDQRATFEWRAFERWATAHELPTHPRPDLDLTGETLLVRYVHTGHELYGWRASYARKVSGIIARTWTRSGHAEARSDRWRALLKGIARRTAAPAAPVDAFTRSEVTAIAAATSTGPRAAAADPASLLAAAALTTAMILGVQQPFVEMTRVLAALDSAQHASAEQISIQDGASQHLIGRTENPQRYRLIAVYLQASATTGRDLLTPGAVSFPRRRSAVSRRGLAGLARLTGQRPAGGGYGAGPRLFDTWWRAASPSGREDLVESIADPDRARRVQDLAYFYTGLCFGGRFAELSRLRIGWLTHHADGYHGVVPTHQHKGGLLAVHHGARPRELQLLIPHAPHHPPHCPACRLADHLDRRHRDGARPGDQLFLTSRRTPLGHGSATRIIGRLTAAISRDGQDKQDGQDRRRFNTRSVRVTTATLAYRMGMSLVEITELGNWRQLSTAQRYVRAHDATADADLVLPIDTNPPDDLQP